MNGAAVPSLYLAGMYTVTRRENALGDVSVVSSPVKILLSDEFMVKLKVLPAGALPALRSGCVV